MHHRLFFGFYRSGYYEVYSKSMTVDKCIQLCIVTWGFKYAGLNQGYNFLFFLDLTLSSDKEYF
jgi:hypothetical protein